MSNKEFNDQWDRLKVREVLINAQIRVNGIKLDIMEVILHAAESGQRIMILDFTPLLHKYDREFFNTILAQTIIDQANRGLAIYKRTGGATAGGEYCAQWLDDVTREYKRGQENG